MKTQRLTQALITSFIPKKFKVSHHKGLPLENGWYVLIRDNSTQYILRTATNDSILDVLSKKFNVSYKKHFWGHWSDYLIEFKSE